MTYIMVYIYLFIGTMIYFGIWDESARFYSTTFKWLTRIGSLVIFVIPYFYILIVKGL